MQDLVYLENSEPVTDSLIVAEVFCKEHKRVMQDIRELDCSEEFREHNFVLSSYKSTQNKDIPKYILTKDGFTMLAMGYTGKEAMQFKERYIQEFNQMSEDIQKLREVALLPSPSMVRELPSKKEAINQITFYDLNQPWEFHLNRNYASKVIDFPTKEFLLQAVADIGAIEHKQMIDLFGVKQRHIDSMLCNGEIIANDLTLDNQKQTIYTLGLYGSKQLRREPEQVEYWNIEDLLEKLVFFEFVKFLQLEKSEPEYAFTIKPDKSPFVGRISHQNEDYKVLVLQRPISRFEVPEDDHTAIYVLTAKDEYWQPLNKQFDWVVLYKYATFLPTLPKKEDPYAFLDEFN